MHYRVAKFDETALAVPRAYANHARGFSRHTLIDRALGSVHMEAGICQLEDGGSIDACRHAFETGIYVLEGDLEVFREDAAFRVSAHDYVLLDYGCVHGLRNAGGKRARWFEMQAPQPKVANAWQDTHFVASAPWPQHIEHWPGANPPHRAVGRFQAIDALSPRGDGVQQGLSVFRFMEQRFGARSFFMMRGDLAPGGFRSRHDHPIEEFYFALSGAAYMDIEDERFQLRPGDAAWTGVGTSHAFTHCGTEPFQWIETQAPQFPVHYGTRNYAQWERSR